MNEREKIIRLWFDMWIKKADLGIDNIFTDDVVSVSDTHLDVYKRQAVSSSKTIVLCSSSQR